MFTGIIQQLGKAINFSNGELEISTVLDLSDCDVGSSICCNGVCLTAKLINAPLLLLVNELDLISTN